MFRQEGRGNAPFRGFKFQEGRVIYRVIGWTVAITLGLLVVSVLSAPLWVLWINR